MTGSLRNQWRDLLNRARETGHGDPDPAIEKERIAELLEGDGPESVRLREAAPFAVGYLLGAADALEVTLVTLLDEVDP